MKLTLAIDDQWHRKSNKKEIMSHSFPLNPGQYLLRRIKQSTSKDCVKADGLKMVESRVIETNLS